MKKKSKKNAIDQGKKTVLRKEVRIDHDIDQEKKQVLRSCEMERVFLQAFGVFGISLNCDKKSAMIRWEMRNLVQYGTLEMKLLLGRN